jgi:hypothetical protein
MLGFDGVAATVSLGGNVPGVGPGQDFTISMWVKFDSFDATRQTLLSTGTGANDRCFMEYAPVGGDVQVSTFDGATTRSAGGTFSDTTDYHHFVGTGTSGNVLTFYIDSVSQGASTYIGGASSGGSIGTDTSGNFPFHGKITEVIIYDRVLSSAEILDLFKKGVKEEPPGANVQGYYPMDDKPNGTSADGDTVRDESSNANDGTGSDGGGSLLWLAEKTLSYAPSIISYIPSAIIPDISVSLFDHHYRQQRAG